MRIHWIAIYFVVLIIVIGAKGESMMDTFMETLDKLWLTGTMDLFGYYCDFKRKPIFRDSMIQYRAKVNCFGWVPFTGRGEAIDPDIAIDRATLDLILQLINEGILTEKEVDDWLATIL